MSQPNSVSRSGWWIVPVVLAAVVVGAVALWRLDRSGEAGSGLPAPFEYDLSAYKKIDPSLILYQATAQIPLTLQESHAVAVGPEDRIYVAGDRKIVVYNADGTPAAEIALEGEPHCLAVAGAQAESPGRVYVGLRDHLEVFAADGSREAVWPSLGEKSLLTSIALADVVGEKDIFVADAGQRLVWRLDSSGVVVGRIGRRDPERHVPGFIIPSPYFDVAVSPDGLLRVTNPGTHRVEAYTFDGDYEEPLAWGKASLQVDGFCGCCNPAQFALLPDGRFVTAEKGIPRVKVYTAEGQFVGVVVGPETLASTGTITEETREEHRLPVVDVACDSRGRVLVLDPAAKLVRIFELRQERKEKSS